MKESAFWGSYVVLVALCACGGSSSSAPGPDPAESPALPDSARVAMDTVGNEWNMNDKIVKTDAEWKEILSAEQFSILRQKGTERAFTGKLWDNHETGVYRCAGCGLELFGSETKFESGSGWPSFYQPTEPSHIETESDRKFLMRRTEVHCARCEGHLGHVFEDGPEPTGLRYCINSAALTFQKAETDTSGR